MRRGDLVTVVLQGDYGKPRPAVIVQSDAVASFDSVLICPLTTSVMDASTVRLVVDPTPGTGLSTRSEIMAEKLTAVSRRRLGVRIGPLPDAALEALSARLAFLLALG